MAQLQFGYGNANGIRYSDGQAFHRQQVDRLIDNAAGRDSDGRAAQLHAHVNLHALVGRHPREVHVQDFFAQMVPLQLFDQRLLDLPFCLHIQDADAMANGVGQLFAVTRQGQGRLFVAINHARHEA